MTINPGIPPTNPYHIARAYGVQAGDGAGPIRPVQPASGRIVITPVQPVSPIARDEGASTLRDAGLSRLVAGVVPGGVRFDAAGEARPSGAALPFYRHPADRNAAATAVSIGRALDVQG